MKEATMADIADVEVSGQAQAHPIAVQQTHAVAHGGGSSDSASLMRMIEITMTRPDFDIDKVQRLLDVKERWEASEARKAFTEAMTGFKAEPIQIFKRKEVSFTTRDGDTTSYKHAELSDVTEAIGPAMAKHQLSYRWDVKQEGSLITVDCIVTHVKGHSEKVTMQGAPDASGKKNAIQQVASTVSYLQRYTLLAATGMSTKGQDDDGNGGSVKVSKDEVWMKWEAELKSAETVEAVRKVRALAGAAFQTIGDIASWDAFKVLADKKKVELGGAK